MSEPETYSEHQLLHAGAEVIERGYYVLYNTMESQYNICQGPMTYAEADSFVRDWRACYKTGCHYQHGIVRLRHGDDVYVFDVDTRKYRKEMKSV